MLKLTAKNIKKEEDISVFWEEVDKHTNGLNEEVFKDLVEFVRNILSLPHSSAAAA